MQNRRVLVMAGLLVIGFLLLGCRLYYVQALRHEALADIAEDNTLRKFHREPRRGDILDIKGNPLATSVFVKTVCADPTMVGPYRAELARVVAPLLQLEEEDILKRLTPLPTVRTNGQTFTNRYVVLKRRVPVDTWKQLEHTLTNLTLGVSDRPMTREEKAIAHHARRAVYADRVDDQLRVYPSKNLASQVLGFVGMSEATLDGEAILQTRGKEGIELVMDERLRGVPGWRVTGTDSRKREVMTLRTQDVDPKDGLNVVLTIDSVIQHILENALAETLTKHEAISVSGVVLRPRTGEILGMATLPDFDPNRPGDFKDSFRRNRMVVDIVEPGSTFKAMIIAGGLDKGIVRMDERFDCERGRFFYGGRILHDHDPYEILTVKSILAKSSNIGAAKIGIKMGPQNVYQCMKAFGFGEPTGVPLPLEAGGTVHAPSRWSKVTIAQLPMGHGVAVTRLQMVMAMAAIANKGWLMRPMLIDRLEDQDRHVIAKYSPSRIRQVISEHSSKQMIEALKLVTTTNGTAVKAALEHYVVAGKTGTAQKVENNAYVRGKYFSSFIGFFPADNPELCIAIGVDEPTRNGYYGGQVAAPAFRQVAELAANYLNIRPDRIPADRAPVAPGPAREGPSLQTAASRSP